MRKFPSQLILLIFWSLACACRNGSGQQNKTENISGDIYRKILKICPSENQEELLVYYFDGDCSMCLAKASYVEKYAQTHHLRPILIAKTLNPTGFRLNLSKLNVRACVRVEENREFENKVDFMKVTKISTDLHVENFDKEIEGDK
ncbi:hypothetical protein [Mucilaginibacter jinjuensis]|uniref:Uncharacterized protein n=1 Tax=Mucilaginibacter jinjuensis TaxID=1176721 RepID=A0ABY7TBS7_9SPHI|nr:hypothetical protein [Mucilaginibacter jinjuensis]WCT13773.1 hypothetical protein PQO05_07475 [Mucilaginibacter jinjuensis]